MKNPVILFPVVFALSASTVLAQTASPSISRTQMEQKMAQQNLLEKKPDGNLDSKQPIDWNNLIIKNEEKSATGLQVKQIDLEKLLKKGPDVTGGGNDVGLDFQAAALRALQNLKPGILDEKTQKAVLEKIKSSQFMEAKQSLSVIDANNREQDAIAVNIPDANSVYVDKKWNGLAREEVRQAMALHEVLSLLRIEKTGDYHISAQLKNAMTEPINLGKAAQVASMNQSDIQSYQKELFQAMAQQKQNRSPYETVKELFDTAPAAATPEDFLTEKDFPKNVKNGFRSFNDSLYIYETTTLHDIQESGRYESNLKYLVMGHFNRVISPYKAAVPSTPSAGPLFPSTPGQPAQPSICEETPWIQELTLTDAVTVPGNDKRSCEAGSLSYFFSGYNGPKSIDMNFYQSASDFVSVQKEYWGSSVDTSARFIGTTYYRRSGNMLLIKHVVQAQEDYNVYRTVVVYGYAWRE